MTASFFIRCLTGMDNRLIIISRAVPSLCDNNIYLYSLCPNGVLYILNEKIINFHFIPLFIVFFK
jgi:hypothetical protein